MKSRVTPKLWKTSAVNGVVNNTDAFLTFEKSVKESGSAVVWSKIVPVFKTTWLVLKSLLSRKT